MNPLVLAALGVGALVLLTGGGGSKTAQPSLPRDPGSGKRPKPDGGGGGVVGDDDGGGGYASGGDDTVRALQRALNLYAEEVGRPATRAASCGTFVRWPLAEDGIVGPQTNCAISETVAQLYADGARDIPGVVVEGGAVVSVYEAPFASYLVEISTGAAA